MKPIHVLFVFIIWFCCCSTDKEKTAFVLEDMTIQEPNSEMAQVTGVTVSGEENAYEFSVTVKSPDTGCDQYADWWEVIDQDGKLIHRRILAHSHVNEQPFTRTGGPVSISKTTEVYVRAHMNNSGYGSQVQKGTVEKGFTSKMLDITFAEGLQQTEPLPSGCDF